MDYFLDTDISGFFTKFYIYSQKFHILFSKSVLALSFLL